MSKLTVGSLFSGIGGIDLGLEMAGGLEDGGEIPVARKQRLEIRKREAGERSYSTIAGGDWWAVEPSVGRVANGIPRRVDRLRALGNAVVPQCAEVVGKAIMEVTA